MEIILVIFFLIVALVAPVMIPRKRLKAALTAGAIVFVLSLLWMVGFRAFKFIYDYYVFGALSLVASGGFLLGLAVKRCFAR